MPVDFTIEIPQLKDLKKAFEHYPNISEPRLQKAVSAAASILAKHTKGSRGDRSLPIPVRSSNLLKSFRSEEGRLYARWYPTAPYAATVHNGRGPYTITAKNGKVLASKVIPPGWTRVSKAGYAIFGKTVHHPGTKGNPFMPKILNLSQDEINENFARTMDLILEDITKF